MATDALLLFLNDTQTGRRIILRDIYQVLSRLVLGFSLWFKQGHSRLDLKCFTSFFVKSLCLWWWVKSDSEYILKPRWNELNDITPKAFGYQLWLRTGVGRSPQFFQEIISISVPQIINQYHHYALCLPSERQRLWLFALNTSLRYRMSLHITIYGQCLCQSQWRKLSDVAIGRGDQTDGKLTSQANLDKLKFWHTERGFPSLLRRAFSLAVRVMATLLHAPPHLCSSLLQTVSQPFVTHCAGRRNMQTGLRGSFNVQKNLQAPRTCHQRPQ